METKIKPILVFMTLVIMTLAILPMNASAATITVGPTGDHTTIQAAIDAASNGDTITIATGTYTETLNLKGKQLTVDGEGIGNTIIDASGFTGYAISNFGDHTTFKDVTLIGTNHYGFKISHVSDITLENIRVEDSGKTGVDLNTIDGATLTNIQVVDTVGGFGIMILDSKNVDVTDIQTDNNPWGGVSVHAVNADADTITFTGTFDAGEDNQLLLESDPPYGDFINVDIPDKFDFVVYGFREGDNYKQWFYQETLNDAETFANGLMTSGFTYKNMTIYDVLKDNYYVIDGMFIQDAVDDSTNGDTIHVDDGSYPGNIIVYKELTIQSENGATNAIIDASIVDYSDYQNEWGNSINYAWAETNDPGLLKNGFMIWSNHVTIDGFNIINANYPSSYNRGVGILIGSIHTTYAGFIPWNLDQWSGIIPNPDEPKPTGVVIKNNEIDGASDGIYNWASSGNTIEYNTITNTDPLGGVGIQCYEGGTNNIIQGNNVDNCVDAISVCGAWPDNLLDVSNTLVENNVLTNNNVGIKFYNIAGSGVLATGNDILDNSKGIFIEGAGGALVAIACCNNIVGNTIGVENGVLDGIFDATNNWWGHPSGPSGGGSGTGDPVGINVDFNPWQTSTPPCQPVETVGGIFVPVDKTAILTPYIATMFLAIIGLIALAFYYKRK